MTENICTRPFAVDWDADGQLDLVVGNFAGTFYWFKGLGKGNFIPKPEQIMAGNEPLRIKGAHSDPFVIDWCGTGALDIISGSSEGGVWLAENIAGKGKPPVFTPEYEDCARVARQHGLPLEQVLAQVSQAGRLRGGGR